MRAIALAILLLLLGAAAYAAETITYTYDARGRVVQVNHAGPLPGGFVRSTFAGNGLLVTNVTTPVHAFVGQITRQIYTSGGATFIGTHGWGSAGSGWLGNLRDSVNGLSGPAIFETLDAQAAAYAAAHFSGC